MTVYVEVPHIGVIGIKEEIHKKLVSALKIKHRKVVGRIIKVWLKVVSELKKEIETTIPARTLSEWLYMAYQQRNYWIYKRLQVVKILYQPESKSRKRSPMPFADTRAWVYEQFFGEQADDEIEEGSEFRYRRNEELVGIFAKLDKEAETCFGLVTSIVCAFYHGSVTDIVEAVEDEIVDEDEVLDIGVIHRAVIIYRYWREIMDVMTRWLDDEDAVKDMMDTIEGAKFEVGIYKDTDLDDNENALRYAYYQMTGRKVEIEEFRNMIYEWVQTGEWLLLAKLHAIAFGRSCKGVVP